MKIIVFGEMALQGTVFFPKRDILVSMNNEIRQVYLYGINLVEEQQNPFLLLSDKEKHSYNAVLITPGEATLLLDEFYNGPSSESRLVNLTLELLKKTGAVPVKLILHGNRISGFYSEIVCSRSKEMSSVKLGVFEGIHLAFRSGINIFSETESLEPEEVDGMPPVRPGKSVNHFISFGG